MLGVFKKRWKPKNRVSKNGELSDDLMLRCNNEYSEPINAYVLPDSHIEKLCSVRKMYPAHDEHSQYHMTYETLKPMLMSDSKVLSYNKKSETVSPPIGDEINLGNNNKTATLNSSTTPNICIESGRIEFVKPPLDCREEKQDYLKEYLEAKVVKLESELIAEKRNVQREKTLNSKLQKQLARRDWLQRDVDRERRLRLDTEARLKGSSSEADRCRTKLSALQRDFSKMEETVRTLLQYKSKFEQLKQDRHSAANSYENQILQLQNTITKLKIENETLKKQINTLEATGISQVQKALVERLRILEHEKSRIEREGEQQRKQYEKCLDDVAKQVVKAVLSQKGLREEISTLQHRVKELETGNCALSTLIVQRLGQKINYNSPIMPVAETRSVVFDIHRSPTTKMTIERPLSCDLTKGLRRLANSDVSKSTFYYKRPQSLNLEICCPHKVDGSLKFDHVLGDETPESGNRDEGYSTMSSDVQGNTEAPIKDLEDVKETNENESNVLAESSPCSRMLNSEDTDVIFLPLSLSFNFINPRHSYPPFRHMPSVPVKHIMRSYSDSHLILKLSASAQTGTAITIAEDDDRTSWYSGGELWDMDYVQHWLRLDETRTAIQQRMEYDASELEDWSMEDAAAMTSGEGSLNNVNIINSSWRKTINDIKPLSLPCIEENDTSDITCHLDQWVDTNKCSSAKDATSWNHYNRNTGSPGDSWSSADEYVTPETPPSKRSSVSCSDSVDFLPPPSSIIGTDFTRDFYRLVKFESSKSLASTSSRSMTGCCEYQRPADMAIQERELALQSVLDFIAEQQQYCISRQAEDIVTDPKDDQQKTVEKTNNTIISITPSFSAVKSLPVCDSNSSSDNLLNSKDSGLCGSDVEIECLPEDTEYSPIRTQNTRCSSSITSSSSSMVNLLRTVPEEDEDSTGKSTSPQASSGEGGCVDFSSVCTAETVLWPSSSKDFIEQLNRMTVVGDNGLSMSPIDRMAISPISAEQHMITLQTKLDETCCCPTGWVHLERDIDFADPKERANLLDLMLTSSRSSSSSNSSTSLNNSSTSVSNHSEVVDSSSDNDQMINNENYCSSMNFTYNHDESYNRLHRLHRVRRQKKASAVRDGYGVLKIPTMGLRQSIVGRSDFFVRFGDKEREAIANFDFLEEMSTTSLSTDSGTEQAKQNETTFRRLSGLSLSDSCGDSE
ncbi:uncharacterized protein LOC126902564 isoform X2 [Daktulosphaira vitifoliae]|uniref:uncharacterized protein LOC126902564 isoform X2 n=1 Tax=Daktulosphaira vitifoliae TaxID=58002 RepID=UPI0021AA2F77|nr:uncharacterized protein LOC126902564 isoform X2 [Daktulosphaira vitifoliae]